jgi:PKHD-type hydroxylase
MDIIRPFGSLPLKEEDTYARYMPFVFLERIFTDVEVDRIRDLWQEQEAFDGRVKKDGIPYVNYETRKSKIFYIEADANEWIYDKLAMACIMTNANLYKFHITGFQQRLQIANYSEGDFFGWHLDIGDKKTSLRKLSISVQLSSEDEYTGGDLQFPGSKDFVTAPKAKGSAVIFPSYIHHRITTVSSGSRKSLVGWISGPHYR